MKKIYLVNILIFLSAFATSLAADSPAPAASPSTLDNVQGLTSDEKALIDSAVKQAQQPAPGAGSTTTTTTTSTTTSAGTSTSPAPTTPDTVTIDPTLAFFAALSSCTAGDYTERNVLATEVGPPMLNQSILGMSDDQMTCHVKLSTPDNRSMDCSFPMSDLSAFSDQRFLEGMLQDTTDSPDPDSLNADLNWSQMKADNCGLGY